MERDRQNDASRGRRRWGFAAGEAAVWPGRARPAELAPPPRQNGWFVRGAPLLCAIMLLSSDRGGLRAADTDFQGATHLVAFDEDTIRYSKTDATGPIARLQQRIDRGEVKLAFDPAFGYLPALLEALGVSKASQMLVFSKTSFQRERISPRTPRSLFFNVEVYVGYIPGSPMLEVSMADPRLGGVFYTLEQTAGAAPRLARNDQCLECHASAKSMGVPGHLVRSFATDEDGVVDLNSGASLVNHRTPLAERWGGYYVTGQHGHQVHRGNLFGKAAFARQEREPNYLGNLTDLSRFFDQGRYLGRGSDIVALMVLEHQSHMHNFITRLGYEATLAWQQYGHVNYLKSVFNAFLRYLLFVDEAAITSPLRGSADYARWFEEQGPKDRRGRSLRQFDLQTRLFRYPCSYLIYSAAFNHLPEPAKARLYQRLGEILNGQDTSPDFQKLAPETRLAIREILLETKPDLPAYWREQATAAAQK
jgi:hypothetical protein